MTYSIIARCPQSGRLGAAIASFSLAIGRYCDGAVHAQIGATLTQGIPNQANNYLGINLLREGRTAAQTLRVLLANDPDHEYRQIGVVDREGDAAAHTGSKLPTWNGHRFGKGYVAFCDGVRGPNVLDALCTGFEAKQGAGLDEQLLAALEAAQASGGLVAKDGGRLPERSAAITVWTNQTYNELDLRVDSHADAIRDLRRIHIDYKPSVAYYEERARHPRNAIAAMEFADMLKKQKENA